MACADCTITIREELALLSSITGPETKANGDICFTHIDGDGNETEICIPEKPDPDPSQMEFECTYGCLNMRHTNGDGGISEQRISTTFNAVQAIRSAVPDAINSATPTGTLEDSLVCAVIFMGCCGGQVRIEVQHAVSAFNDFSGTVNLVPQISLNGGAFAPLGANKIDSFALTTSDQRHAEHEFTQVGFLTLPSGPQSVCFRMGYLASQSDPVTSGNIDLGDTVLTLSSVNLGCC